MATTTIGRALAARRRDTGLDLEAAAARLGVSRSTYSSYERGTRRPSPENLRAVAVFLDVTIDTVLDLYGATCVEQARRVLQPDEVASAATASDRARRAPRHDVAVIKRVYFDATGAHGAHHDAVSTPTEGAPPEAVQEAGSPTDLTLAREAGHQGTRGPKVQEVTAASTKGKKAAKGKKGKKGKARR